MMARLTTRTLLIALALALVAFLAACGNDTTTSASTSPSASASTGGLDLAAPMVGPHGEPAASPDDLKLTDAEIQQVRQGNYTAAVTWAGPGPWYDAVDKGFNDGLKALNIKRVATAQADYDPAKQATQVSTVMAKDPDVVLGSPVDAAAAAEAYRPVVDAGKVLVLSDNVPNGYEAGNQYVGFVSGNRQEGATLMADEIAKAIGGEGDIGMVYYDADYYVTNILDDYFRANIEQRYPNIKIVSQQGFTAEDKTQDPANAMITQNPNIKAIYVTWSIPAEGVIAALRAAGRTDVKIVTHDLNPTNDVNLAAGKGPMYATVVEDLHSLGYSLAMEAAFGLLKKDAPAFVAVPYILATPETIVDAYPKALGVPAPDSVVQAAGGQ